MYQSINVITYTNEILGKDDTIFFIKIHLLPDKLLLVVVMHPLDGSRANQLSRVEPSMGAVHPLTR
jgi:hypothetical protein